MFDNLRQDSSSSPLFQDSEPPEEKPSKFALPNIPLFAPRFLGMTPSQRFIIALLVFLMVCILGSFCLVATSKFYITM